jgi:hypothetical protein
MPTTRPRHVVTETDELSLALDAAQKEWPGLTRPKALLRLVETGARMITEKSSTTEHAQAVTALTNFAGTFDPSHHDELRAEWPK